MASNQVQFGNEVVEIKRVRYEGTDTLYTGYNLCYNADYGTATAEDKERAFRVEKPSATNLQNYAGVVTERHNGTTGPAYIEIYTPVRRGQKVKIWTEESCVVDSTVLTLQAGSYAAGGVGEGKLIGKAMQTVDRSTTNGTVQALLVGLDPAEIASSGANGDAGPSPAIWDQCPWDEIGRDPSIGFRYFNDYMGTIDVTTADGYIVTAVTSGAIVGDVAAPGGVLIMDSAGNNASDDGVNVQLPNCGVLPTASTKIFYEARVKVVDAGDDQYFIGLAGADSTLIAVGIMDDTVDKAGFFRIAASTADFISTIAARTTAEDATADVAAIVDATYVNLGFVIDGLTSIKFYVDGVLVETGTSTANLPNAFMCLSYVAQVEQTSADAELSVDWVKLAQIGGRDA